MNEHSKNDEKTGITPGAERRRRSPVTVAMMVEMDFDSLYKAMNNLLVENKNFKSGYYFRTCRTTEEYVRTVLKQHAEFLMENVERAKIFAVENLESYQAEVDQLHKALAEEKARSAKAMKIADDAMLAQLQAHSVQSNVPGRYILCNAGGNEVTVLSMAEKPIVEAFEWLRDRGLVRLGRDEIGDYITMTPQPGDYVIQLDAITPCWLADGQGDPARTLDLLQAKRFTSLNDAKADLDDLRQRYPGRSYCIAALQAPEDADQERDEQTDSPSCR